MPPVADVGAVIGAGAGGPGSAFVTACASAWSAVATSNATQAMTPNLIIS